MEGDETGAFWTEEIECADRRQVDEHEDELIHNEIRHRYIPREEPSGGPVWDNMTSAEVEKLVEENIKTAVEVTTGSIVTGIVEGMIEDALTADFDEQK